MESFSLSALMVSWVYAFYIYGSLPEIIPIHFDFKNRPDGYGNKLFLFFTPFILTLVFILLNWVSAKTQYLNYPVKITEENRERQFTLVKRFLRFMKLMLGIISVLVVYEAKAFTSGPDEPALKFVLPVLLALLVFSVLIYVIISVRNK
jgi:hypothetical protein